MPNLKDAFTVLNDLETSGAIQKYAVAGAMAFLFYTESARTYDLNVFVFLPPQEGALISMAPLYKLLEGLGYHFDAEHVMIHNTPVRFLPAYNLVVEEALEHAILQSYDDVQVRVISPEYLIALALQTGGKHRRVRAEALLDEGTVDQELLTRIFDAHGISLT